MAAHNAANAKGLAVKATEERTYYIGKGREIAIIKTDVDWSGAKFIIDDVSAEDYRNPVYAGPMTVFPSVFAISSNSLYLHILM